MSNTFRKSHLLQVVLKRFLSSSSGGSAQKLRAMNATADRKILQVGSAARKNFDAIVSIPEIQLLNDIFKGGGHELRIAGGAVRDLLTGSIPHDIDFATTATPCQMISFLSPHEKDIRLITTNAGKKHGTITARIKDRVQYEITTLRVDKLTDGRHAEVEFILDWMIDASRRDLTINAMFLDMSGCLYDFFNGSEDLEKKLIRFVGDPNERIQEDFLRILRYFRFYARYGCGQKYDRPTMDAIRSNLEGLSSISGERIWTELKRILPLSRCNVVIPIMFGDLDIGKVMGFESSLEPSRINEFCKVHTRLFSRENKDIQSITLFTSLIRNDTELESVARRLKFSNAEVDTATFIIANRDSNKLTVALLKRKLALSPKQEQSSMKSYMIELLRYSDKFEDATELGEWKVPQFPFRGHLLREKVKTPKDIGRVINALRELWADNGYQVTDEQISMKLDELLSTVTDKK